MYFELTIDPFFDYGILPPEDLPWDLSFMEGVLVKEEIDSPFVFRTKAKGSDQIPDFYGSSFPAMSSRFLKLIEEAGVDNLQKFPAIVKSQKDGTIWKDYYVVNILGKISCADFSRSVYSELFPGSYEFEELAIDAEKAKGALLFRLQESPDVIIIHKSVGKHIMLSDPDEELTGWDVREIIQ